MKSRFKIQACGQIFEMLHSFILMLIILQSSLENADAENHLKIVQAGDTVHFACLFTKAIRNSIVWVKQRVGEKPLQIASVYQGLDVVFANDHDKQNRFFIEKDDISFNLSITNTDESDSATYYCVTYSYTFEFGNSTDLIVKAGQLNIDYQRPASDPESPEEHLQCTVVTQSCAEKHNIYWFRHESAESPPAMIYTQENRSTQCERSSDPNSTAHKCIYNLPKTNQDPGIYYCAVAMCGEILFGEGRKVNTAEKSFQAQWITTALFIIAVIVIIVLSVRLHKYHQKDGFNDTRSSQTTVDHADGLNYAALNFQQKSSMSRRSVERNLQDTSMYAQTRHPQI